MLILCLYRAYTILVLTPTDDYPLVVRLPCHKDHIFDMDCVAPWLKMNSTCPLDRTDFLKKKTPPPPPSDDEEEYDDMYA